MIQKLHAFSLKTVVTLAFSGLLTSAGAQTVTIYRSGLPVTPTYFSIGSAVAAAMPGDSLVISAGEFKEYNIVINKSLTLKGTVTPLDSTIINAQGLGRAIRINSGNVTFNSLVIKNGKINNDAGGGIANYGSGNLTITGYSMLLNNQATGIYANGGAVFSVGPVTISGNTILSANQAENGAAVYSYKTLAIAENVLLSDNRATGSGGAVFSDAGAWATIGGNTIIRNNIAAGAGGAVYSPGIISDNVIISGNQAEYGGAITTFGDSLIITGNVTIAGNVATAAGGAIWLNNANGDISGASIMNNAIPASSGAGFGGAIYNVNGNLNIYESRITGNTSAIAAIYNSAGALPVHIIINKTHIFNPDNRGKRMTEVYNSPAIASSPLSFQSDSCWWGRTDTIGVVRNRTGVIMNFNSWVVSNWTVNAGVPIGFSSVFPVEAEFTLNDGHKIDSLSLRSLHGTFTASQGDFIPPVAMIDSNNLVYAIYKAPMTTDTIDLLAIVDADTFKTSLIVTGLKVPELQGQDVSIYPNPSTGIVYIKGVKERAILQLFDLTGKQVWTQQLTAGDTNQLDLTMLSAGQYIMRLDNNAICYIIQKQ